MIVRAGQVRGGGTSKTTVQLHPEELVMIFGANFFVMFWGHKYATNVPHIGCLGGKGYLMGAMG